MGALAHSAREDEGIPTQTYKEHVENVIREAVKNAKRATTYFKGEGEQLVEAVRLAATFHDLGKLDEANQNVLKSGSRKKKLPLDHQDAGAAYLCSTQQGHIPSGCLVHSHHGGLPNFSAQEEGTLFRSDQRLKDGRMLRELTDKRLGDYIKTHLKALQNSTPQNTKIDDPALSSLGLRLLLSCLVDADHSDTARNYGNVVPNDGPPLRAVKRLELLNRYVAKLAADKNDERTRMRTDVYNACKDAETKPGIYACDSPVGTGKTTSVMAQLLKAAEQKELRRIFVVLPFTNIIDQSVDVYRRALVLPGERPEDIVAAHHHKAEFEDPATRQFSFLWHAPIIVVTAVQFFETLASKTPSALRKLHQLPGSAIFIDEAHAALPAHLLPQAWKWLNCLQEDWNCHLVLGSGSLNRFWELEEFSDEDTQRDIPDLISKRIRASVSDSESKRIAYRSRKEKLELQELLNWLHTLEGPRLLIVNTVQSAAVIAGELAGTDLKDRSRVEHLSTALCPRDRKITLNRVKARLNDSRDKDWTLVATSCVEAGVDLSFRNGLRERASHNSLIQTGGRINRQNNYGDAELWDFQLIHNGKLKTNPGYKTSALVLGELFKEDRIGPEYSTEAMKREIRVRELSDINEEIKKAEAAWNFPEVEEKFHVIPDNTVTAIVEPEIIEKLNGYGKVDFNEIQRLSVSIYRYKIGEYGLQEFDRFPGLYRWNLLYDDFLGYMAGVLKALYPEDGTLIC